MTSLTIYSNQKFKNKNILIDKKSYKHLVMYFTRYDFSKSIKILSLYCNELMGTIEET